MLSDKAQERTERTLTFIGGLMILIIFGGFIAGLAGFTFLAKTGFYTLLFAIACVFLLAVLAFLALGVDMMYSAVTGKSFFDLF